MSRLRVLLVITRGEPGGAQVHVLDLVRGLRHSVEFHLAIGDDEWLAGQVRELGVQVTVVAGLQRDISAGSDARALANLRAVVRSVAPHVVHTHSSKAGLLGRIAGWSCGVPTVHTAHAWSFSDGIPWRRRAWAIPAEGAISRITSGFITVSNADREIAMRFGVAPSAKISVIHNGVSDHPARATPGLAELPTFVMVARMAAPKDHALLLRAVSRVLPPIRLQLVGDGPERGVLEALAKELEIGERVEFLGARSDVPEVLAKAHAAVLVSKQEGFPLVILEAMRAGLPVIASKVGGVRESVLEGITGFLVRRDDMAGLSRALDELATDPELRATMGAAGRRAYEDRFTAAKMCVAVERVYAQVAPGAAVDLSSSAGAADQAAMPTP